MSDPTQWETIINAGLEGGAVVVSGRKSPDGVWELRMWTTSMTLDDNDDETWVETTRDISSLAEAFEGDPESFGALIPHGSVHPEFRTEMLDVVERLAPRPGGVTHRAWTDRNHARWTRACAAASEDAGR